MSPRPEYVQLGRLLDRATYPLADCAVDSLTGEMEKDLLIALSQAFREVKQWTCELDSPFNIDSDEELLSSDKRDCSVATTSDSDNRHCLTEIVGSLVYLLAFNNQYAQQLVGNILVAISEFVIASVSTNTKTCHYYLILLKCEILYIIIIFFASQGSNWDDFMHLLCLTLEIAIHSAFPSSSRPNLVNKKSSSEDILKLKLKTANSFLVADIFRVFCNILKYLKRDFDEIAMKSYQDSISSSFLNISWDFLSKICVARDVFKPREVSMLYGNLLRFLCSLAGSSSSDICEISKLVPNLTVCCHALLQSPDHVTLSQYIRHKLLMLMFKISSRTHFEDAIRISWLNLLQNYFEDQLLEPISGSKTDQNCSLEGSPFLTTVSNPVKQSRHLQRLSVFLFLRFSLNLVGTKRSTEDECVSEDCSKCSGLLELRKWLKIHIYSGIFTSRELYLQHCVGFTRSFIQLYIQEDDILFEILLQLYCIPFDPNRQCLEGEDVLAIKDHHFFLSSDLFNLIHLFHLFLKEILYDHQVLLDYLISKDSGSKSAEYLLRSLRLVCDHWNLFIEFTGVEEDLNQLYSKRQKLSVEDAKTHSSHDKNYSRLPYLAASDCLIALRKSIERLKRKNLFPYNPQVLLRRLMRFEELYSME